MNRRNFLTWSGLSALLILCGSASCALRGVRSNPYYQGPVSDHFDGLQFFNPDGELPRGFRDLLRWQFGGEKSQWPDQYPSDFPANKPVSRIDDANVRVTMIGHASLLIQTAGVNLLTDPVWSKRTSPISFAGPTRVNTPGVMFEDLPNIDVVLVTHNHYDHLDVKTLERLVSHHDPLIVTSLGNDVVIKKHVRNARCKTGDWGDTVTVNNKLTVHLEPCHHWSARGTRDRRMALWSAFVIDAPAGKLFHIGDTGYHDGNPYRRAAHKHGGFKLATLPIGAYEPRWFMRAQHQNPEEAVQGFKLCNAEYALGHHWGTFQLTNEAVEAPLDALNFALQSHHIDRRRFAAMRPGQTWDMPV